MDDDDYNEDDADVADDVGGHDDDGQILAVRGNNDVRNSLSSADVRNSIIRFSRNYVMLFRGCPQIDFFRGRFIPRMSAILVVKGNNEVNKSLLFCIGYTSVLGLRCVGGMAGHKKIATICWRPAGPKIATLLEALCGFV